MKIAEDTHYAGVNDTKIDLFEGQYRVPYGMTYNSYVITDEKIAVFDTADRFFVDEWLTNVKKVLDGRKPDYLIINHMEPDHSSGIDAFLKEYPDTVIAASAAAFSMMGQFFRSRTFENRITVTDKTEISLGKHNLKFLSAPMVHWPDVVMTYDEYTKTLFSADAFGAFGIPKSGYDYKSEARRYYCGIVGKYGMQVSLLLKKASAFDIERICPLHGKVLEEEIKEYVSLYQKWSSYEPESDGVLIAYTSVYGNTKKAAFLLEKELKKAGAETKVFDLARCDMSEAVANAFRYRDIVLATTTYNTDIFPPMRVFIEEITERGLKDRKIAIIENGTWAPSAARKIKAMLENSKNFTFTDTITIKSSLSCENEESISKLANELANA